jgi:hypothetical protein
MDLRAVVRSQIHRRPLCAKAWRILRAGFPSARRFVVQKFLAILCRANSTHVTEGLRKMLLAFETTGHGNIQYRPSAERNIIFARSSL